MGFLRTGSVLVTPFLCLLTTDLAVLMVSFLTALGSPALKLADDSFTNSGDDAISDASMLTQRMYSVADDHKSRFWLSVGMILNCAVIMTFFSFQTFSGFLYTVLLQQAAHRQQ